MLTLWGSTRPLYGDSGDYDADIGVNDGRWRSVFLRRLVELSVNFTDVGIKLLRIVDGHDGTMPQEHELPLEPNSGGNSEQVGRNPHWRNGKRGRHTQTWSLSMEWTLTPEEAIERKIKSRTVLLLKASK